MNSSNEIRNLTGRKKEAQKTKRKKKYSKVHRNAYNRYSQINYSEKSTAPFSLALVSLCLRFFLLFCSHFHKHSPDHRFPYDFPIFEIGKGLEKSSAQLPGVPWALVSLRWLCDEKSFDSFVRAGTFLVTVNFPPRLPLLRAGKCFNQFCMKLLSLDGVTEQHKPLLLLRASQRSRIHGDKLSHTKRLKSMVIAW